MVQPSVCSNPKWFPILDVILLLVEDERHAFAPAALDVLLNSQWLHERPYDTRELLRLSSISRSYDDLTDHTSVTIDDTSKRGGVVDPETSNTNVHPLDALLFLMTPFQVIVENEWYDGGFLLWMAKALGFTRFIDAYRKGRFVFRHAGGKDWLLRSATVFSDGVWARRDGRYARAFQLWLCMIMDNDARYPGDAPNSEIVERARPYVAFVHQLRKRSIESYIPAIKLLQLDSSPTFTQKVDALDRLNYPQRMHYDMKKGFRVSKREYMQSSNISAEQKSLFANVSDKDWENLIEGFGRRVGDIYVEERHRPNVEDSCLKNPDDCKELRDLIAAIYKRI